MTVAGGLRGTQPPACSVADGGVQSRILEGAVRRPNTALHGRVCGARRQKEKQQ